MSNPTAGILLLLGAAGLIAAATTEKGQKVLAVLSGKEVTTDDGHLRDKDGTIKRFSGGDSKETPIPKTGSNAKYVPGFVGEKGAAPT